MKTNLRTFQKQTSKKTPEIPVMVLIYDPNPGENMHPAFHKCFQGRIRRKRPVGQYRLEGTVFTHRRRGHQGRTSAPRHPEKSDGEVPFLLIQLRLYQRQGP
jgi:hypothetical protein